MDENRKPPLRDPTQQILHLHLLFGLCANGLLWAGSFLGKSFYSPFPILIASLIFSQMLTLLTCLSLNTMPSKATQLSFLLLISTQITQHYFRYNLLFVSNRLLLCPIQILLHQSFSSSHTKTAEKFLCIS